MEDNKTKPVKNISYFSVKFPEVEQQNISQGNEEKCEVDYKRKKKTISFHDYHEIYKIPGFYEYLFYKKLKCCSPQIVCSQLKRQVKRSNMNMSDLNVLDLGAGNGMVGEELKKLGVNAVVGVDIIKEAEMALHRDRPGIYEDYHVADITEENEAIHNNLQNREINSMVTVAALGFGDTPPLAFSKAYNFISPKGWVAYNIKEDFVSKEDETGFSRLIKRMTQENIMRLHTSTRYRHRFCLNGEPLYYMAVVGRKLRNIPGEWLEEMEIENQQKFEPIEVPEDVEA